MCLKLSYNNVYLVSDTHSCIICLIQKLISLSVTITADNQSLLDKLNFISDLKLYCIDICKEGGQLHYKILLILNQTHNLEILNNSQHETDKLAK